MKYYLRKLFLLITTGCVSLSVLAGHEAPVVSAGQDTASTQIESTSAAWQTMPNEQNESQDNPQNQNNTQNNPEAAVQDAAQLNVQNETPASAQNTVQNNSSSNQAAFAPAPTGSTSERVARLEQQMANLTQMNLPQQIVNLRQSLDQVQGQLQVEDHTLKTLTAQQTSFYQDLQQQIAQLKTGTTTVAKNNSAPVTSDDAGTYNAAFKLISAKQFPQAKTAFENYLTKFPKGHFAANAHFWLGEIAMNSKDYSEATTQFQDLISQYPTSSKVPDAKLKIATIHAATGKTEIARKEFAAIQKSYPGTTAAQLASIRLQQLPSH